MLDRSDRLIIFDNDPQRAFHKAAVKEMWHLDKIIQPDHENEIPYELIFKTNDGRSSVHYIEDYVAKLSYVIVIGDDVAATVARVKNVMTVCDRDVALKMLDQAKTREQRLNALLQLGIVAPQQFDEVVFNHLTQAMSDKDPEFRRTAVWLVGYTAWPQFKEPLEKLAKSDPDDEVRGDAEILLESLKEGGVNAEGES
jgi:HEAT repeats